MGARLRIHPGYGVGPFLLGMTRAELIAAARTAGRDAALEVDLPWLFDVPGIDVGFSDTEPLRACWIVVSDPSAELAGRRLIGLGEDDCLTRLQAAGIGPILRGPELEPGLCDLDWPAGKLCFQLARGRVEAVIVEPFYDAAGERPLWPMDARDRVQ